MGASNSTPSFCANHTFDAITKNVSDIQPVKDQLLADYFQCIYGIILPICAVIGILGNILNLITLRSRSLQTVPFIYIRCIAYFDLAALVLLMGCTMRLANYLPNTFMVLNFYQTHIELAALNSLLQASLYVACILTLERFLLIIRPLRSMQNRARTMNPRTVAKLSSLVALVFAVLLYVPMTMQYSTEVTHNIQRDVNGTVVYNWTSYSTVSSYMFHCQQPSAAVFTWYERVRETIRCICVVVMTVLNIVLTHQLNVVKSRKKSITGGATKQQTTLLAGKRRRSTASALLSSFSEQRLTVMMLGITALYVLGNAPQSVVMIIQESSNEMKTNRPYQIFRGLANLAEAVNHCMNFYVFCITSNEYSTTFLRHCVGIKRALQTCVSRAITDRWVPNESSLVRRPGVAMQMNSQYSHSDSLLSSHANELVYL